MAKTALVISGGGSKGAFAVGALKHIIGRLGVSFDLVAGTSTGALIAPLAVTRELGLLERLYTTTTTADLLTQRPTHSMLTRASSVYAVDGLKRTIGAHLSNRRSALVLSSGTQMFVSAVCLQDGATTHFHTGRGARAPAGTRLVPIGSRDDLCLSVLASSDQPVFMPPVQVPRGSKLQYVDGGLKEYAPLSAAIENGATDIYAILLSPARRRAKTTRYTTTLEVAGRALDLLLDDVADNDLALAQLQSEGARYLASVRAKAQRDLGLSEPEVEALFQTECPNPLAGKQPITLRIIRPAQELPSDGLEFDPPVMKRMLATGQRRARQLLGRGRDR